MSSLVVPLTITEVRELMLADLKRSGLSEKDSRLMSVRPLTTEQLASQYPQLTKYRLPGYVIPYGGQFFRYRFLTSPLGLKLRYVQPTGAPPRLYRPRNFDWAKWEKKPDKLLFTEGEKKAVAGCKHGFPTIGLGGVWNFRSKKQGWKLLPDIETLPLEGLHVYIVYDSDARSNTNIIQAQNQFANELLERKAFVYVSPIPGWSLEKGLDDFLLVEGPEALAEYLVEQEEWDKSRAIREMNEKFLFVRNSSEIRDCDTGKMYSDRKFLTLTLNRNFDAVEVKTIAGNQVEVPVEKNAGREWLKNLIRNDVQNLVYKPGHTEIVGETQYPDYNVWKGWGVEPEEGDITLFVELVDYLLAECSEKERKWFWDWLAYPIQNPGAKMSSCVFLHGGQGTGKNMLGEIVGAMYGENYTEVDDDILTADFNSWCQFRQFVMGSEIGTRVAKNANRMKNFITRPKININTKYVAQFEIDDCINYFFNANGGAAMFLENDDRRNFVVHVQGKPKADSWYTRLREFKQGKGPAHLMYYLLERDLTGFNPKAHPPVTAAKDRAIDTSRNDAASWAENLRVNGNTQLKRLASPAQIWPHFTATNHDSLGSVQKMKITLHDDGRFRQALGGKQIKINRHWGMQRLWILDQKKNDAWSTSESNVDEIRKAFVEDYGAGCLAPRKKKPYDE